MNARSSKDVQPGVRLTEAELDAVSGGLNPQPLPPGLREESFQASRDVLVNPDPVPW